MTECDLRENKDGNIVCIKCKTNYGHKSIVNIENIINSNKCAFFQKHKTIIQKINNISTSISKFFLNGMKLVDDNIFNQRISICKNCEFYEDKKSPICLNCGCYLEIKALWASESCPLNKWTSIIKHNKKCGSCNKK